ncbi:DNA-binding response regulator [Lewinellaceae bacterium SD302]|nr:DNA-binding response regulator [Lewinellaceae bacterium SD302]
MTINYIIVDDERMAHEIIEGYCNLLPYLNLVQHCYDAIEAMECLQQNQVDLMFLDLNMPKLKGFDFLKTLQYPPKVIVTTAHREYALEGHELNVTDYLLKPFSFERFVKAVNRLNEETARQEITVTKQSRVEEQRIFIRSGRKHIQLELQAIQYVEAYGNYCKLFTADREMQVREKISTLEVSLPTGNFIRVHKSFIVSKRHIDMIEGNRIRIGKSEIPIGKLYRKAMMKILS